ncbi:hypothetical protein ACOI1C_15275 [Bacillus sp. DJP31]|uniref:hypothetical protein n=1 Tax=Bacillus sp. DJP31 TaxID=3409789 RepID=UPI003BB5A650
MRREMSLGDIESIIKKNGKQANEQIAKTQSANRKKRSRTRSEGEVEALNQVSIRKWEKAIENGNVKKLGKNKMYYDYRDIQ